MPGHEANQTRYQYVKRIRPVFLMFCYKRRSGVINKEEREVGKRIITDTETEIKQWSAGLPYIAHRLILIINSVRELPGLHLNMITVHPY
jgi:hypothetical protein